MARSLQISLLGGSLGSLFLRGLEELASVPSLQPVWPELPTRELLHPFQSWQLDGPSILLGVLIGLSLGPVIDGICLLQARWTSYVRAQLRLLAALQGPYYRQSFSYILNAMNTII